MDKKLLIKHLRNEFESQRFADFYTGPMEKAITGEFVRGSEEEKANEKEVEEFLGGMVDRLFILCELTTILI